MKVLSILTRVYVEDMQAALVFYEGLLNLKATLRFSYPEVGLELAQVGVFLLIAGSQQALRSFRDTTATMLVDSLSEFRTYLEANGAVLLRGPKQVPTGSNMTVRHPDGIVVEYVEHNATADQFRI